MCLHGIGYGDCILSKSDGIGCVECQEVHAKDVSGRLARERDLNAEKKLAKVGKGKPLSNKERKAAAKKEREAAAKKK